ncbi:uncharacterized protein LOC125055225 [Pieris napi]|uniref:uncharacterized protein LOC125055225 n=1 Tax=Pieris napi TaxID=78633 RepID=UPI001FB986B0|nr:uncharacterized protein LOC125055225 [Pieris napi]
MVTKKVIQIFLVVFISDYVLALSFPGPQVYVVTPAAPRPFQVDAKPAPFYYRNWMRRMDSGENSTSTTTSTTTTTPRVKTPDLIFAEFESDGSMKKSIRKLLENERIQPKSTTSTALPIYVPETDSNKAAKEEYGLPVALERDGGKVENHKEDNDYYSMYNNFYNKAPAPVYLPTTTQRPSIVSTTTPSTTTTLIGNVENIWHIIDNEKLNEENGKWDEVPLPSYEYTSDGNNDELSGAHITEAEPNDSPKKTDEGEDSMDENFALPGFATNTGSAAENESRAIRTEQNIRFPYVNLKPFQMKNLQKPMRDLLSNSKKGNHLLTSLDNFFETKNPVRGEAQDFGNTPKNQPIDRYNPAQPYLPQAYSSKSKQSDPNSSPPKATASLVPPPPPPSNGVNLPSPISYDSFPPYALGSDFGASSPSFPAPAPVPESLPSPPVLTSSDDDSTDTYSGPSGESDGPSMDIGYRYKAPPPPSPPAFLPTVAPISKPFNGYSYNKPDMPSNNVNSMMPMDQNQGFQGYHYSKPKPTLQAPQPETYDSPPSYGHADSGPTYGSAPEYGDSGPPSDHHNFPFLDSNGNDFKDAGMMPPPDIKPYGGPPSDHGFPIDFPTDFKFPHDFDDHDHDHDIHHPPSSTEMPRVNRFSYYYLGKKLYYLPLYFSVYFIVYVGALIIKAVLRHKIVYPNSWRPNTTTAGFFSKRSVDDFLQHDNMHELTGRITHAIATAAEKYTKSKRK